MTRTLALIAFGFFVVGCANSEREFKPSGVPALKLRMCAASTKPVENWQPQDDPYREGERLFISPESEISNADVARTAANYIDGKWVVEAWLTDGGRTKLANLSKALAEPFPKDDKVKPTNRLAILIDEKLVFAPIVYEQVVKGHCIIRTKDSTEAEARRIARGIVGP